MEFFLCTLIGLPVSFPKSCSEQLFCKELSEEFAVSIKGI